MPERGQQFQTPAAPQKTPGVPENTTLLTLEGFAGLNTKASRPAIEDQQTSWCDNWMPLGPNNLRTLYDVGGALYTAASGVSITSFYFGNIGDQQHMYVFQSDGSVVQIHPDTGLVHGNVLNPGGIASPTNARGVAQWGSKYAIITAPQNNGYFLFDDVNTYHAGTLGPEVTLTNSGLDYTSQPTMTPIGGTGAGATFSAQLQSSGSISRITVTNPGHSYSATDFVTIAFAGGGSYTTAVATAAVSGGAIEAITMTTDGTGYTAGSVTVKIMGGGGVGATAIVQTSAITAGGAITAVVVTASGQGYTSSPTVVFTDPNNPVAQATVNIMPFGIQGTAVETYQSRVWVTNGAAPTSPPPKNLTQFTAPNNPQDFNATDGGGQFTANDSFVRVGYHGLKQSNGFLYLVGDSSINYIAGVQTAGTPPLTTFSNQNVDPQIGTPWPDTLQVYSRALVFANTFGVFAMYGGAVQKVSTPIDNLYTSVPITDTVPSFNGLIPSAAVAVVFGIHVYMLLLPIIDPTTQQQRNALLMWDGQKWWTAGPSVNLTFINSQEINSLLTAYGTDGRSIYPLFKNPSSAITKTVQSKLWDSPSYLMVKLARWVTGMFQVSSTSSGSLANGLPANISVSVDTEFGTGATVNETSLFSVIWLNNLGGAVTWYATGNVKVTWLAGGFVVFGPDIVNTSGRIMGMTAATTAPDITLISLTTVAQQEKLNL